MSDPNLSPVDLRNLLDKKGVCAIFAKFFSAEATMSFCCAVTLFLLKLNFCFLNMSVGVFDVSRARGYIHNLVPRVLRYSTSLSPSFSLHCKEPCSCPRPLCPRIRVCRSFEIHCKSVELHCNSFERHCKLLNLDATVVFHLLAFVLLLVVHVFQCRSRPRNNRSCQYRAACRSCVGNCCQGIQFCLQKPSNYLAEAVHRFCRCLTVATVLDSSCLVMSVHVMSISLSWI